MGLVAEPVRRSYQSKARVSNWEWGGHRLIANFYESIFKFQWRIFTHMSHIALISHYF